MEEMIVMVKLKDRAFIPVHVLAHDQNDAVETAMSELSLSGLDYSVSYLGKTMVITFPQSGTHINYRGLWKVV